MRPRLSLIQRAETFGEVDRIVQWADEDRAPQTQLFCASRGEGHEFERSQGRCGPQHRFLRPGALKAKGLGSDQVVAQPGRVECAVWKALRDGYSETHGSLLIVNKLLN